jgi:hypothetical protein
MLNLFLAAALCAQAADPLGASTLLFQPNSGLVSSQYDAFARARRYRLALARSHVELEFGLGCDALQARMELVGASAGERAELDDARATTFAHLCGPRSRWAWDVPSFGRVRYDEVWPGIDVVYLGVDGELRYDFVLAPHADVQAIALRFANARAVSIEADGSLRIETAAGVLTQPAPVILQDGRVVEGGYVQRANGEIGFEVAEYDRTRELLIDPTLSWLSFLGSDGDDSAEAIALDAEGNVWIAGSTAGANFPREGAGAASADRGGPDVFVSKLDPSGANVLFSAYIGGDGSDRALGLAIDSQGRAIVCGDTTSSNFPTQGANSGPALQSTLGGFSDAFVLALSNSGALQFSTYLGATEFDTAFDVAVDVDDTLVLVGSTAGGAFPTASASQATHGGGVDGFLARLQASGAALEFSTFYGDGANQELRAVVIEADGSLLSAGRSTSSGALVQRFDSNGAPQASATVSVGALATATAVAVLGSGEVLFGGQATAATLTTVDPIPGGGQFGGGTSDGFLVALDPTLTSVIFATYVGSFSEDLITDVVARDGHVYAVLETRSSGITQFSAMTDAQLPPNTPHTYLVDVDFGISPPSVQTGAYLPLPDTYRPRALVAAPAANGPLFIAGASRTPGLSIGVPFFARRFGEPNSGEQDAFVARIDLQASGGPSRIGFAAATCEVSGDGFDVWIFRTGPTDSTVVASFDITLEGATSPFNTTQVIFSDGRQLVRTFFEPGFLPSGTTGGAFVLSNLQGDAQLEPSRDVMSWDLSFNPSGTNDDDDDKKCPLAGVCDGTPLAPGLDGLRVFRDGVLSRSELGRAFTRWYYERFGPRAVELLRAEPWLLGPARFAAALLMLLANWPLECALTVAVLALWRRRRGRRNDEPTGAARPVAALELPAV